MLGVALAVTVGVDITATPTGAHAALAQTPVTSTLVPRATTTTPPTTAPPVTTAPTTTPPPPVATTQAAPAPKPHAPATAAKPTTPTHPAPTQAGRVAASIPFGVYVGSADPSGVASFASSTGTHPAYAADYLPINNGWAGMSDASQLSWLFGAWRGTGYTLDLGVPIIPTDSSGNPVGTLAGGAAGQYNQYFVTLGQSLVSYGEGNAVLRLGWEFNGNWYPWAVSDATDAANFAAYFRQIVTSMRSVPGQSFKFVWNPDGGGASSDGSYTPAQAYPGSAYVDDIGIDMYDQCWSSPITPQNAWEEQLTGTWGLDWVASFASAEGRPIVFPEWGVTGTGSSHGMGDDPYFIDQFGAWIVQHDVAWTAYFNYDASDGSHDLFDGSFPATLAAFRTVFG
ncbi:MAG: glycosyl hydrolase [Acidimicrobiales bacterium]|jgi:hypothetical protein